MKDHFLLKESVISEGEEELLVDYISSLLKRKRYEGNHWDSVIAQYKELELHEHRNMPEGILEVLDRLQSLIKQCYVNEIDQFQPPHVIDLDAGGRIGHHVDSVKHSGGVLCGLSLMSSRIMELAPEERGDGHGDFSRPISRLRYHLPPRSLYFLEGPLRFQFTHSILGKDDWDSSDRIFCAMASNESDYDAAVQRRLSIVFRDVPGNLEGKDKLGLLHL